MLETYRCSGRVGVAALPAALIVALVLAALAWVYQALVDWIPLMYLSFLATLGFAGIAAVAAGMLVRSGRCRNVMVAALLGLLVTAPAVLASHYFAYMRARAALAEEFTDPSEREAIMTAFDFPMFLRARVDTGWNVSRRGSKSAIRGAFVYAIWGIEALVVIAGGIGGARVQARTPFCETCEQWAEGPGGLLVRADQDDEGVARLRQAALVDEIVSLKPAAAAGPFALEYSIQHCPSCEDGNYLTIKKIEVKQKKGGKEEKKETGVLEHVRIGKQEIEALIEMAGRDTLLPESRDDDLGDISEEPTP